MKSNKNSKSTKNAKPTVGRPESKVVWPNGRFTREQAYKLNGCYEKPARVCKLTVINHLNDALKGRTSTLIKMKGEFGEPVGGKLGRKPEIYMKRAIFENGKKNASNLRKGKAAVAAVSIPVAEPVPAATPDPTPVVTPAPVADVVTAAPADVATVS